MSEERNQIEDSGLTRRDFLRMGTLGLVALSASGLAAAQEATSGTQTTANVAGSDRLRIGLIGCGGRGTGAFLDCIRANEGVELYAMGDLFQDKVDSSRETVKAEAAKMNKPEIFNVSDDRVFTGFDAYKNVIASGVDLVILATPPGFRPLHLRAAIEAGKHVFAEKPVAVDPVGVRSVIESARLAKSKGLAVVVGTQRRHDPVYLETMRRIQDGALGDLVAGQCYWLMGELWVVQRTPEMSEMEWQCRNWLYFDWLSGDHIVEQHMHNIDVMNWAFGGPPVKATGMGGRQSRTSPEFGNIFDHFAVEFEYANGAKIMSMCRQTKGAVDRVSERLVGTKGVADPHGLIEGVNSFKYDGATPNPYEVEHADLIASIRKGEPINELERVAESTMTAILGRTSAYTGKEIKYSWLMNSSKLDLTPKQFAFGDNPVNPVPIPGQVELI